MCGGGRDAEIAEVRSQIAEVKSLTRGALRRFSLLQSDFCNLVRLRPCFSGGYSFCDRGMRVEEPLHPARWRFLCEILISQLVHRRNEGFDIDHRLEAIAVGLALVEARVGVERRHQQERKHGRDQNQQG